jgi:serine phosphatase RsbU (regulator of sigma subunit)
VLKLLEQATDNSPKYIVEKIMKSVDLYRGGAPFRDDLTLLAFSLNESDQSGNEPVVSQEKA